MLTPDERRGAALVIGLVLLGALWDVAGRRLTPPAPEGPIFTRPPAASAPQAVPPGAPAAAIPANDSARDAAIAPVDLNRAGAAELDALPGIGPVLAGRILEHRARNGPFRSVEELRAVRGVGDRLMEKLAGRVRAGP